MFERVFGRVAGDKGTSHASLQHCIDVHTREQTKRKHVNDAPGAQCPKASKYAKATTASGRCNEDKHTANESSDNAAPASTHNSTSMEKLSPGLSVQVGRSPSPSWSGKILHGPTILQNKPYYQVQLDGHEQEVTAWFCKEELFPTSELDSEHSVDRVSSFEPNELNDLLDSITRHLTAQALLVQKLRRIRIQSPAVECGTSAAPNTQRSAASSPCHGKRSPPPDGDRSQPKTDTDTQSGGAMDVVASNDDDENAALSDDSENAASNGKSESGASKGETARLDGSDMDTRNGKSAEVPVCSALPWRMDVCLHEKKRVI